MKPAVRRGLAFLCKSVIDVGVKHELADAFLDVFYRIAKNSAADRVLAVGVSCFDPDRLKPLKKKLVLADMNEHRLAELQELGFTTVLMKTETASRIDRLKAALVAADSAGHLIKGEEVLCAVSNTSGSVLDTMLYHEVGKLDQTETGWDLSQLSEEISSELLQISVDFALRIGRDGYEGRPLGALLVIGDSNEVLQKSHDLTLNPFLGHSETDRNMHDQSVRDAMTTFAMLDGAFIVRDDGVVLAAGRHVRVGDVEIQLPPGLGARHTAAASISMETSAVAIVVSQSSGTVKIYKNGKVTMEIDPGGRRVEDVSTNQVTWPKVKGAKKARKSKAAKSAKAGKAAKAASAKSAASKSAAKPAAKSGTKPATKSGTKPATSKSTTANKPAAKPVKKKAAASKKTATASTTTRKK